MIVDVTAELTWEAPGPGPWFLAREHVPTPVSRLYYEALVHAATGWDLAAEAYGLPDGPTRWGHVNGWMYYGGRPVDAATVAAREATAAETLVTKRWREDVRRWHEDLRPRFVAASRALQAEEPSTMDDAALEEHVRRALDAWFEAFPHHFGLHHAMAVGGGALFESLLARGMDRVDVIRRLGGGSPGSARARAMVDAIVAEIGDREVRTIDDVRGPALDAYLGEYGWRGTGRDELRGTTLIERPDIVVAAVQARQRGAGGSEQPATSGDPEIDELRALYGLNDDNGGITGSWPMGLVRRAAHEVARRAGCVDVDDVFEASRDELVTLLRGHGPTPDELADRAARRRAAEAADPPAMLTGPPLDTGPPAALPPSVARLEELRSVLWAAIPGNDEPLHGFGVGDTVYRGRACVIEGDGIDDLQPGDVLVAFVTHSAHNTVFPIAGAVATEAGGLLSHPAVLARELGLPAVVGVRGLLDRVRTGDVVEVDAAAGVVRVVTDAP